LSLQKVQKDYDATDIAKASKYIKEASDAGTILTGLLYLNPQMSDLHEHLHTAKTALRDLPLEKLSPGKAVLEELNKNYV
jgi:2-oxoglutarate/2-oxoacid ferredoxin oxidoreductase subunit beta